MTIRMTITSSKLLLSILRTEYETPTAGELVTGGHGDMDDLKEADRMTRKELDPKPLHIGRMGSDD
jgi:hypothetical protein